MNAKQNPQPGGLPVGLLERIQRRTKMLRRTKLLSLVSEQPLHEILSSAQPIHGKLKWSIAGQEVKQDFTIKRNEENDTEFLLETEDLPAGCTPLSIVLGRFHYGQFDTANQTIIQEKSSLDTGLGSVEAAETSYSLAADDFAAEEPPARCVAAKSKDIVARYYVDTDELEITANVPEDCVGEMVVAEIRSVDDPERILAHRVVQLDYRLPDSPSRLSTILNDFRPSSNEGDMELVIRSPSEKDLPALEPDQVGEFLAKQRFVSLPLEKSSDGLKFRVRWEDQQHMAAVDNTCWTLQASLVEEGK